MQGVRGTRKGVVCGMITYQWTFNFSAARRVSESGNGGQLYGDTWYVNLTWEKERTDIREGEYGDISPRMVEDAVGKIRENYLHHHYLNDTMGIKSPTEEKVAEWLYGMIHPRVPTLTGVSVSTNGDVVVEYIPDRKGRESK